jgi:hypothetical protein
VSKANRAKRADARRSIDAIVVAAATTCLAADRDVRIPTIGAAAGLGE